MPLDALLGHTTTLELKRFSPHGAHLKLPTAAGAPEGNDTILLPGRDIPEGARVGDAVEVFVHLDSDDRPVATTQKPLLERGEVAFLEVTDTTRIGAFVNWGLGKDLLIPHAEQIQDLRVGERHPIGVFLDATGRLAGTMRVTEMLRARKEFPLDAWVSGVAWRNEPGVGVFVIVEKKLVGLVPEREPTALRRGEAGKFRISHVWPDGKIELSLRRHAYEEQGDDAAKILAAISAPGASRVGDHFSPDQIRERFGISKKAFKRAVGHLLKTRAVRIDESGYLIPLAPPG